LEFYGSTLPNGHLWPDGTTFVASDYVELNSVLGGNFKPDRGGRIAVCRDNIGAGGAKNRVTTAGSGIDGSTLGANGGAQNVTLDATMIPSHTHPVTDPGHQHGIKFDIVGSGSIPGGAVGQSVSAASHTENATTGITIGASPGGGLAHQNMPPAIIANYVLVAE